MTNQTSTASVETPARQISPMRAIRAHFPNLRRTAPTAIVSSGGEMTVFGCLCGAVHTAARMHRDAKHVREWQAVHSGCAAEIVAAGLDGAELRTELHYVCGTNGGRHVRLHSIVKSQ